MQKFHLCYQVTLQLIIAKNLRGYLNIHNIYRYIQILRNCSQISTKLTFKLPQQAQGVSIFESTSSSWHILHSTISPGDDKFNFGEELNTLVSSTTDAVAWKDRFLLSIAASNVDSVINRSTSNTKWSPMIRYKNENSTISFKQAKGKARMVLIKFSCLISCCATTTTNN